MHIPSPKFSRKNCLLAALLAAQVCMMNSIDLAPSWYRSTQPTTPATPSSTPAGTGASSWRSPLAGLGAAAVTGTAALAYSTYSYLNKKLNTNYTRISKAYQDIIDFVNRNLSAYEDFSDYDLATYGPLLARDVARFLPDKHKQFLALVKNFNGQGSDEKVNLTSFRSRLITDINSLSAVDSWTARALPNYQQILTLRKNVQKILNYVESLLEAQTLGDNLEPEVSPKQVPLISRTTPATSIQVRPRLIESVHQKYNSIMAQKDPQFTIITGKENIPWVNYVDRINGLLHNIALTRGADNVIQLFISEINKDPEVFTLFIQDTRDYIPGVTLGNQFITLAKENPNLFAKIFSRMPQNLQDITRQKWQELKVGLTEITPRPALCPAVMPRVEPATVLQKPGVLLPATAIPTAEQSEATAKMTDAEIRRFFKGSGTLEGG